MLSAASVTAVLRAYDDQWRTETEVADAQRVERIGPLLCAVMWWGGFVTYRDLGGLSGDALDDLIESTVSWFRDHTEVADFEWKTRGHDAPSDLPARLVAAGLVAEDPESVMIGEASGCAVDVPLPEGVRVRRILASDPDAQESLAALLSMQESVFGLDRVDRFAPAWADLVADREEYWLAEADSRIVCAGRLEPVAGTEFASIWGGACVPEFRGQGIYRALTSARARSALARGKRWLHSDSTPMSRPILERSGLVAVTTTTPFRWTR